MIELIFLIAVFLSLRWLTQWLKASVAGAAAQPWPMKALALLSMLLPFPAAGKQRLWSYAFWIPVQVLVVITLYFTYCLSRIAYWDHEVKQLCTKDGGVKIYEKFEISKAEAELLSTVNGQLLALPKGPFFKKGMPVYQSEIKETLIHEGQPSVGQSIYTINRVTDDRVLARIIRYSRGGGDPFGPWEVSGFVCPDRSSLYLTEQKIYLTK